MNLLDPANVMFPDTYVNELHAGHVGIENVTTAPPWDDAKQTFERFSQWFALFRDHSEKLQQVERPDDIDEAKSKGKVGIILGLQGASPIGEDLNLLLVFRKLGLRILGLAYQRRNIFADGCGEPKDSGLSKLGEKLVSEANRLGILIDLSHAGRKAAMEATELSRDPVIFSHSNVKALCNHARNADDEQIKALSERGGLIGLAAYGPLLRGNARATMKDFFDHIDYVVKLVGVNHVGLGLDLYPPTPQEFWAEFRRRVPEIAGSYPFETTLEGLNGPAEWVTIAKGLEERGYSEDDIRKILGQNAARIFREVWRD